MRHRIIWPVVAALALGVVVLVISQSTAQRAGGGMPGMPGMPGRFVVAHASANQVLILDTATGQVYRAKEDEFKKLSELPRGGHDVEPPARDRRLEPRDKFKTDERTADKTTTRDPARDRRLEPRDKTTENKRPPQKEEPRDEVPDRREER